MTSAAPFFAELADGPEGGHALWAHTPDRRRIRIGLWPEGARGTVLLLPGRTEYVEKYGRLARDLKDRGYAVAAIDWRGQGLAERAVEDRLVGHVDDFDEYQRDFDTMLAVAQAQGLPRPYFLMAHSMGGCIGLRAVMRGAPVNAAVFSAPMWGISMAAWMRPIAHVISALARPFGQAHRFAPGTNDDTYIATATFQGNVLTTDPEMWHYMHHQIRTQPDLALGGPSLGWLRAALRECGALAALPSPQLPCITALGSAEKVVDVAPIHLRMAAWPGGRLDLYLGAEHEVPMEQSVHRTRFLDASASLFDAHR